MIRFLSVLCFLLSFRLAISQDETSSISFGYNILESKPVYDVQFNRTASSKAKDKYEIKLLNDAFAILPASEAHFGSGTETSENNVIIKLNTYYKNTLNSKSEYWTKLYKVSIISPQITSDKSFSVLQAYAQVGFDYITYYLRRDKLGNIGLNLGTSFDFGVSRIDSLGSNKNLFRATLNPSFYWSFFGKRSNKDIPVELDGKFYYRVNLSASYLYYYFFQQDERITDDISLNYFSIKAGYRFIKHISLIVEYKIGRTEPNFEKINTINIGLSFVN